MNKKLIVIPALLVAIGGGAALAQTDWLGFAQNDAAISMEQAREAALKEVNGQVRGIEYDGDDFNPHYEIDVVTNDEKVEMDIDAQTGQVKVTEREVRGQFDDDDFDDDRDSIVGNVNVSQEEAVNIALAKAAGTIESVELDGDNNRAVYEIEIRNGNTEYDLDIDAMTGAIVKYEEDLED